VAKFIKQNIITSEIIELLAMEQQFLYFH